jgi:hypothetical protein
MAVHDPQRETRWRALLTEWKQSRLTLYAFCKQRRLARTNFTYWARKLGFLTPTPRRAAFVPLTLIAEPMAEIHAAGVTLKLPLAASPEQIARWIAAIRPC